MTSAQFTIDRLYTKDLYVNGAQISHPTLASLLTVSSNVGINNNDPKVKLDINGTDGLRIPVGNDGDRPTITDLSGVMRYNTTKNQYEAWALGEWQAFGGSKLELYTKEQGNNPTIKLTKIVNTYGGNNDGTSIEFDLRNQAGSHTYQAKIYAIDSSSDSGKGSLRFQTANGGSYQDRMTVYHDGSVGIGTSTPGYILDVSGTGAMRIPVGDGTARSALTGTNGLIRYNTTDNQFEGYGNGAWGSLGGVSTPEGYTRIDSDNTDGLEFYTGPASANERMVINSAGNVGIGTSTPGYILDVSGTGAMRIPVGDGTARSALTGTNGLIRYNTTDNQFEGYGNGAWGSLGGVSTPEGYTKVTADDTNGLEFFTGVLNPSIVSNFGGSAISPKNEPVSFWSSQNSTGGLNWVMRGGGSDETITTETIKNSSQSYYLESKVGDENNGKHNSYSLIRLIFTKNSSDVPVTLNYKGSSEGTHDCFKVYKKADSEPSFDSTPIINKSGSGWSSWTAQALTYSTSIELICIFMKDLSVDTNDDKAQMYFTNVNKSSLLSMVIKDGNVGIGTTSPGYKLDVNGTVKATALMYGTTDVATELSSIQSDIDSKQATITGAASNITTTDLSASGVCITSTDGKITAHPSITTTELGYLDGVTSLIQEQIDSKVSSQWNTSGSNIYYSSGNVGIGTNSPDAKLKVDGDIKTTNIYVDGSVGIGTNNPTHGVPLDVRGEAWESVNLLVQSRMQLYNSNAGIWYSATRGQLTSSWFVGRYDNNFGFYHTQGSQWEAYLTPAGAWYRESAHGYSDRRIKKNITDVPDDLSLQKLRNINIVYYDYILNSQNYKTIGFIAQQVKEHLPEAVNLITRQIPNEMREIIPVWLDDVSGNYKLTITDLSNNERNIKYKFGVRDNSSVEFTIKEIKSLDSDPKSFIFEKKWNEIFLYGKEVDDFHTINKEKIFAVGFSATQEIDRIQQAEKVKLAAAEAKIASLETQLAAVLTRLDALESA